jgi:hypothetical protein
MRLFIIIVRFVIVLMEKCSGDFCGNIRAREMRLVAEKFERRWLVVGRCRPGLPELEPLEDLLRPIYPGRLWAGCQ